MNAKEPIDSGMMLPGLVNERKRIFSDRARGQVIAPNRITNSSMPSGYTCPDLVAPSIRPGADDALEIPSRYGDRLHYRDGRKVDL